MQPSENILADRVQVVRSMKEFVGGNLGFLAPVDRIWQPSDLLPDLSCEDWREQMDAFRQLAQQISDAVLVVLVGDMVTEEALPNYAVSLNLIANDVRGVSDRPWAKGLRGWTEEENRHGDLLNTQLRSVAAWTCMPLN